MKSATDQVHRPVLEMQAQINLLYSENREMYDMLLHQAQTIKDMITVKTPAKGKAMPQNTDYWIKRANMDMDIILRQKKELGGCRAAINRLTQKLEKHRK